MVKVNNGTKDVPSVLLTPVAVTKDNIKNTVVADGFWTVAQILNTPQLQGGSRGRSDCSDRSIAVTMQRDEHRIGLCSR